MPHRPTRGKTGVHLFRSTLFPALLFSAGCGHQDPFPSGEVPDSGPRSTNQPARLTLSAGVDLAPAWREDGTGLIYSFQRETSIGNDRCLGELPPIGGTRRLEKCVLSGPDADSVDALGPVAMGPGARAAWVDARSLQGRTAPDKGTIRVGSLAPGDSGAPVRTLPYPAPSGTLHVTATHLGWLTQDLLTYIGADVFYTRACQSCKLDTVVISREAVLLDLATSPATVQVIPNTTEVTSLFPSSDGLSIYYTRPGDTRVFRQVLASGAETVVHDFGGGGIARDVNVRGSILTAVVGGKVSYGVDPLLGPRQVDSGGVLFRVDLTSGSELPLPLAIGTVQHPALSPDGATVVVEGIDTMVPPPRIDLWLFRLP
jgi:hypothetical protein